VLDIVGRANVKATTRADRPGEIVVFSVLNASVCSSCGADIAKGDLIRMEKEQPLCLVCADLDHLVYLPAGEPALSRRGRKHSTLSAVVVRFSRARKRYERQGLLVELPALERAEQECLNDEEQRARARERAGVAREPRSGMSCKAFSTVEAPRRSRPKRRRIRGGVSREPPNRVRLSPRCYPERIRGRELDL
jgi:hypothetical protein